MVNEVLKGGVCFDWNPTIQNRMGFPVRSCPNDSGRGLAGLGWGEGGRVTNLTHRSTPRTYVVHHLSRRVDAENKARKLVVSNVVDPIRPLLFG